MKMNALKVQDPCQLYQVNDWLNLRSGHIILHMKENIEIIVDIKVIIIFLFDVTCSHVCLRFLKV